MIDGNHVTIHVRHDGAVHGRVPDPDRGLRIRPDAAVGSRTQFTLDPSSIWTCRRRDGQRESVAGHGDRRRERRHLRRRSRRRLVSGGNGGVGPRRRIQQPLAAAPRRHACRARVRFVSPTEMRFTLREATNMTGSGAAHRQSGLVESHLLFVHARHPGCDERPAAARRRRNRSFPARSGRWRRSARYPP